MSFFEYVLTVLTKFGGGGGGPQNDLVRFGLSAIFFAILFGVAWSRQRQGNIPREHLLLWGFALGFVRESFMFTIVSLQISNVIDPARLEIFFPPLEHAIRSIAVVFIAGAFLRFLVDKPTVAYRYLQIWVSVTIACYLVTVGPWAQAVLADPTIKFGMHWGDWLFRIAGVISLAIPIGLLLKANGWVRNVAIVAISGFFLDDFLMLFNLATNEIHAPIYGPIRHNLHLWAIPLLGYVYLREQANELGTAQDALKSYSEQLEEMVATRTGELRARTEQLEQQTRELAKAKDAAEIANHAKSEFLSNMNHELRSPLNAILGFTRITTRQPNLPQDAQENLAIIMRSSEHLLTLINQVLDLAKIEAGRTSLTLTNFDLYHLLDTLEDMFALTADAKAIQLHIVRANGLPRIIQADEVKLRQVLINLLSNALKFTDKGNVTLQVIDLPMAVQDSGESQSNNSRQIAHRLQFDVIDTGPGIPAAEQEQIFEAFIQSAAGRQNEDGTGLGLPISRNFVQMMGGNLTVESPVPSSLLGPITNDSRDFSDAATDSSLSRGAKFTFAIPVVSMSGIQIVSQIPEEENRVIGLLPNQPTYRILAVDDKAANRQLLMRLLAPLGFEVREAANGEEAIAAWETWQPHLIWMDMRMPVMDGYEATTRIKATTQGQATVIVALTASAFEEERAIVLSAGCDDFMRKPFREADIFAMMAQYLGVRYRYTTDAPETVPTTVCLSLQEITTALKALPMAVQRSLRDAIVTADIEALDAAIEQISHLHQPLAINLAQYAHAYDYEQLEQFLDQTVSTTEQE